MTQNGGKGAGGEDADALRRERLHRFLCELVEREGRMEATELLGVNYRTLVKAEKSGEMTGRMSDALERLLLTWDGGADDGDGDPDPEPGGDLARRVEALEAGLEELARELRGGLDALRAAVGGAAEEDPASRAGKPAAQARAKPGNKGAPSRSPPAPPPVAGLGTSRPAPRRRVDPELVTREPAEDDPEVYGGAWPLVAQWRQLKARHPVRGRSLSWLTDYERLLVLELAMLEEHGLTLPPAKQPVKGLARRGTTPAGAGRRCTEPRWRSGGASCCAGCAGCSPWGCGGIRPFAPGRRRGWRRCKVVFARQRTAGKRRASDHGRGEPGACKIRSLRW